MNAFGLLLWGCAFVAVIVLLAVGARGHADGGRLERAYLWGSWLTYPLALPLMLMRLSPPPGPSIPPLFTILGLIRAMLGVLLALVGLFLVVRARRAMRLAILLAFTTAANVAPFLTLALPFRP